MMSVTVPFPGASSEEVEEDVNRRIEESVNVFPYVAFFVLLVALIEASFILPAHILREKRWSVSPLRNLQDWLDGVRDLVVPPAVSWSVRNIPLALTFAILDVPTVAYALKHDDADALVMAATKIKSFMTAMPGLCGISDSVALGKRIFEIHLTPAVKAAGLTPASVGRTREIMATIPCSAGATGADRDVFPPTPFDSKLYGHLAVTGASF